jgi:hypothetical protein
VEPFPTIRVIAFVKRNVVIPSNHDFVAMGMRSKPLNKTVDFACFAGVCHVTAMNKNIACGQWLKNEV